MGAATSTWQRWTAVGVPAAVVAAGTVLVAGRPITPPTLIFLLWPLAAAAECVAAAVVPVWRSASRALPAALLLLALALTGCAIARSVGRVLLAECGYLVVLSGVLPLLLIRCSLPAVGRRHRGVIGVQAVIVAGCAVAVVSHAACADELLAAALFSALFATGCGLWLLWELTGGEGRRRVLWIIVGAVGGALSMATTMVGQFRTWPAAVTAVVIAIVLSAILPLALVLAIVVPRRMDVRLVLVRGVVALVLLTLGIAAFSGLDGLVRLAIHRTPPVGVSGLLATALAAVFHPVLLQVRTLMDELLLGGHADPLQAMTRLGDELAAGRSPRQWLDTVRQALGTPGVALRRGSETIAESGDVSGYRSVVTPLQLGDEEVGELVIALTDDQLRLTSAARTVLELVAAPLAQATLALQLNSQLQESRLQVVTASEEERRRLRRDLHDGLGPTLSGIAYTADAVANLMEVDAAEAMLLVRQLRADAGDAIAEVRRIVDGLRPRALDELGLIAAVSQRFTRLRAADGRPMTVAVTAPDELGPMSAAAEVVAYRVAIEAVTNAAKHSGADQASIDFAVRNGRLHIRVRDRGSALPAYRPGVGLATMRERVDAVGGTFSVTLRPGDCTVTAEIPTGGTPPVVGAPQS